jgi:tRNA (guanine37-N1)-methyltransferase
MRVDVVSIFPDYLAPLELSLLGKARERGLVDLHIHDLRAWAHDRHRTVDDTPYGGGAGMVMKPEPWGDALDAVIESSSAPAGPPVLVVPTPSGTPFDQAVAEQLARAEWLVFACGRYEGIDQRVVDHYAGRLEVRELSLGDVVLNGGEVAALAMIEAVVRLVPGFMGNPESLREESHGTGAGPGAGLLEYPVYTKPASWRGLEVPEVLRSGDHTRVEEWRLDQARRRTVARRPDLLTPAALADLRLEGLDLRLAVPADAAQLLTLQRACWVREAQDNELLWIPPLTETLDDVRRDLGLWTTWMLTSGERLVASVRGARGHADPTVWEIGRLMVAEDLRGRGLGRLLLEHIEATAPDGVTMFSLFTGARSTDNLRMYKKAGYRLSGQPFIGSDGNPDPAVVRLDKRRR